MSNMQKPPQNGSDPNGGGNPNNNKPTPPRLPIPMWMIVIFGGGLLFLLLMRALSPNDPFGGNTVEVAYSFFRNQVDTGNVKIVAITGTTVRGEFKTAVRYPEPNSPEALGTTSVMTSTFSVTLPPLQDSALLPDLNKQGVTVIANDSSPSTLLYIIVQWLPVILIGLLIFWTFSRARTQQNGIFGFGQSRARQYNEEHPQVTFVDVAGEDAAKEELTEMVDFLKDPDKYIRLGARIPRGVLLVGPPGTGKTLLARAVAGEAKVPFFSLSASEFVEMFVGVGASRVRDLFTRAKAAAPSIVFIDEIDAVGRQRGAGLGGGNDEREQTLNQLLVEMDGFDQRETVIVMAATNRPDVLDPALLRPGRFDRQVTVDLPDRKGREDILKVHTRDIPLSRDVDLAMLAGGTIGFSGADLENLANEAALSAARNRRDKVTMRDFQLALDRIMLGSTRPPLSNEHERKVVAYHEAGHALVAIMTPEADPVVKVTIVPRGRALGVTQYMPADDRRNYSKDYLMAMLYYIMGGRSAEETVFNQITTGAENDLRQATNLARSMVSQWGMNEEVGPVNYGDNDRQPFLGYSLAQTRQYSDATAALIDKETKRLVEQAHQHARHVLRDNRDKLDALAKELLDVEVIDQARVYEICGMPLNEASPMSNP
ncbi:MAG: ATP-dependent metallopeptidase FtsH/Yme1/Tma family protein [Anaerolineales bacterium]|nr:ATP-dependent metallopeptidase FtsH/Yme1/Tma family protein [Anaerolineales bacterium]